MLRKNISTIQDLENLIKDLLEKWHKKFLLKWDLWVGKTEFTKQLAKQIWIKNISSPTYTYINIYDDKMLHGDFYRIDTKEEFLNLGILDEIQEYEYISIEWPKFQELYEDEKFLEIEIKKNSQNKREIIIK